MTTLKNPQSPIEMTAIRSPDALRLAEFLSIAVRVEPELLRRARLRLHPGVDAGVEADLWFSPLVQAESPLGLVFFPAVVNLLRNRLATQKSLLAKSWELISAVHRDAPQVIRDEEEITYLSLAFGQAALDKIEPKLRNYVKAIVNENRLGVARWAVRAFASWPEPVRRSREAARLIVAASSRLGTFPSLDEIPDDLVSDLRFLLPSDTRKVQVGVRLLEGYVPEGSSPGLSQPAPTYLLELSDPPAQAKGVHRIEAPLMNPFFFELSWRANGEERRKQVSLLRGQTQTFDVGSHELRIRTGLGDVFALRPDVSPASLQPPARVHIIYSHRDDRIVDELRKHLSSLERLGIISQGSVWDDTVIRAGAEWSEEITRALDSTEVILLMISPDFMASDYIYNHELKRVMERHDAGEALVIPIFLRPVAWAQAPFGKLQALPTGGKPLTSWHDHDEAFADIAEGIRRAIESFRVARETSTWHDRNKKTRESDFLPRPPFVGFVTRRDEQGRDIVERLKEELAQQGSQLITLSGPGGIGKTTLAAEAARALRETLKGCIVWSSAEKRADFTLSTLLDDIATQLGHADLRTLAPDVKEMEVRALVEDPPTLVVLDSYETIAPEGQRRIEEWFTLAMCSALFTSRHKINSTLNISISAMSRDEAEGYLERLVAQTRDAQIFSGEVRQRIYETAEANPLFMQWVVAQIDAAQEPNTVLEELAHGEGDAAERVFDRSFNLPRLGDDGRATLLALSLFVPSATREALAVTAGFGDELKRVNEAVKNLSTLGLIKGIDENRRFTIEGLTRSLAGAKLSKDEHAAEFRQRFVNYLLNFTIAHRESSPENYDVLEMEKDNLLNAIDMAFELKDWESVGVMAGILTQPGTGMLSIRGYWDEAIQGAEQSLKAARKLENDTLVATALRNIAVMHLNRGGLAQARKLLVESLSIARRTADARNTAATLHQLAIIAQSQGELDEARRLYDESLEINKKLGYQSGVAGDLHQLAILAQSSGALQEARRFYDESLQIEQKLDDQNGIATTLHQLGRLAQEQGDLAEARRLYRESLDIADKLGDQSGAASSLHQLGMLESQSGNPAEARDLLQRSLSIFERLKSPNAEIARRNLARIKD